MKKTVDTNLGITIILIISSLFLVCDFFYIGNELGWDLGFNSNSSNSIDNNIDNNNAVTEDFYEADDDILILGNEMYDKAGKFLFHPEFDVLSDDNGDVKFIKSETGEFVQTSNWQKGIYFKVVSGIDEYKNLFTDNFLNTIFVSSNGEYFSDVTPSGGRGTNIYYIDTVLSIVSHDDNRIVYEAKSYYYNNGDDMINRIPMSDSNCDVKTNTFEMIKENDVWKVSEFTLAY